MEQGPFSFDESLAGVRRFITETMPVRFIDEQAFLMAGEPDEQINEKINEICSEFRDILDRNPGTKKIAGGCAVALATMLRDRVNEIECAGVRPWH